MKSAATVSVLFPLLALLQGCSPLASSPPTSGQATFVIGIEPSTQELIEGLLAIYETSESSSPTAIFLTTPDQAIASTANREINCAFILGAPSTSNLFFTPIADEYLSVIVPIDFAMTRISRKTLAEILAGTITNWSEIGGPEVQIAVISPSERSSIYRTVTNQLMVPELSALALVTPTESESVRLVSQIPGSIGIVRSGSVTSDVHTLEIEDNLLSGEENSQVSTWLTESVYFIALQEPVDETRQLLNWILSPSGQKAIQNFVTTPAN